jgi:hypothetical protein
MSDVPAKYDFLSYVRRGAAADLDVADDPTQPVPYRGKLDVDVYVESSGGGQTQTDKASAKVRVHGPIDVVGIDPRHVIRTEPWDATPGFEPNYLAGIEFDHPDFPWLFTPVKANGDRLRPWVALIALADGEYDEPKEPPGPLPVITVNVPAIAKLPDLADSWAWAHAQVAGGVGADTLDQILEVDPGRATSRLLCPRRLDPSTHYTAFVVPAFEHGRLAGLGQKIPVAPGATTDVAWHGDETSPLELPVYHRFAFRTSESGDFESLVRELVPRELAAEVGIRDMDVDQPGWGLPGAGGPLGLSGALRSVSSQDTNWSGQQRDAFRTALANAINDGDTTQAGDPKVVPPLYGRWHAARSRVSTTLHGWVHQLNLDPRNRAIAGFGSRVVLDQRSNLMASAWDQVAGIDAANETLRQAQLARGSSKQVMAKHLADAGASMVMSITAPVQYRLRASPLTVAAEVARSALPPSSLSPAFRRLVRAGGPLRRRQGATSRDALALVERLARGDLRPRRNPNPGGLRTLDDAAEEVGTTTLEGFLERLTHLPRWLVFAVAVGLLALFVALALLVSWIVALLVVVLIILLLLALLWRLRRIPGVVSGPGLTIDEMTPGVVADATPRPGFQVVPGQRPGADQPDPQGTDSPDAAGFREAAGKIAEVLQAVPEDPDDPDPLDLEGMAGTVLGALDPDLTVPARIGAIVSVDSGLWDPDDPLEPIMAAPEFRQPMYAALRDISQDLLLPGMELVEPNTVAVLETNEAFIEAYMVGLNHEMAKQLLWAEYPTDQRGSYFRQFWDVAGYVRRPGDPNDDDALREQLRDIPPIHRWSHGPLLGEHPNRTDIVPGNLVLLIRGELLRRYPNAVIYATEAALDAQGRRALGAAQKQPLFRGTLTPDVTFFGFDLDAATASGDGGGEGWFFVFEPPPSEPRFGFEPAAAEAPSVSDWNDLSWSNFAADPTTLVNAPVTAPTSLEAGLTWPTHSAGIASATMRRPVRVGIHASVMLPADA